VPGAAQPKPNVQKNLDITDGAHLTGRGYALWRDALMPDLAACRQSFSSASAVYGIAPRR
jgi:hypothetical protein